MEKCRLDTLKKIIKLETEMFLKVPTGKEPPCREDIDSFKIHRKSQFSVWSEKTCLSYINDLIDAESRGENLLTLKYARMDNLIPPRSDNILIDRIIKRLVEWQKEMLAKYPNTMEGARNIDGFTKYLRAELETYSYTTIKCLWDDVEFYIKKGVNMSLELYKALALSAGYNTLNEMEAAQKSK